MTPARHDLDRSYPTPLPVRLADFLRWLAEQTLIGIGIALYLGLSWIPRRPHVDRSDR